MKVVSILTVIFGINPIVIILDRSTNRLTQKQSELFGNHLLDSQDVGGKNLRQLLILHPEDWQLLCAGYPHLDFRSYTIFNATPTAQIDPSLTAAGQEAQRNGDTSGCLDAKEEAAGKQLKGFVNDANRAIEHAADIFNILSFHRDMIVGRMADQWLQRHRAVRNHNGKLGHE